MPKIAVDARPLSHPQTGIGVYLKELLTRLIPDSKHDWYLYSDRPFEWHSQFQQATIRTSHSQTAVGGVATAQIRFPKWAKRDQCDLFWSPRHHLPLVLPASIASVITLHDLVFLEHPETMTFGGRNLERLLTPRSLNKSRAIITTTQSTLDSLTKNFPDQTSKAHTIHLSSSLHTVVPQQDTDPIDAPYALYCGSLEPRKNLDRLIRAFLTARTQRGIKHKLVIVSGGGWNSETTQRLIRQQASWIHYLPNTSEARKAHLYQHCDFVALPSLYEGFGIPIVEALKMGKPLLTANCSAMPEIAGDAAEYVDPTSTNSIIAALETLCLNSKRRDQLAENAASRASNYSWEQCSKQTLARLEASASVANS